MYALNRSDFLPVSHPYLSQKTTTLPFSAMSITVIALAAVVCAGILYALKNANRPKKLELPSKRPLPWGLPDSHALESHNEAILRKLFEKSCYTLETLPELPVAVCEYSKITSPIMLSTFTRGSHGGYPCLLLRISGQSPNDHRIRGVIRIWQDSDSVLEEDSSIKDVDDDSHKSGPLFFNRISRGRSPGEVYEEDVGAFKALQTLVSQGEVVLDGYKWKLDHSKWKV